MVKYILSPHVLFFSDTSHKNPAFGGAQIRELTEIFVEKSIQVRNTLYLNQIRPE